MKRCQTRAKRSRSREDKTTHAVDRHECKVLGLLDLAGHLAVDGPIAQLGVTELGAVRPLERVGPDLVAGAAKRDGELLVTVSRCLRIAGTDLLQM